MLPHLAEEELVKMIGLLITIRERLELSDFQIVR